MSRFLHNVIAAARDPSASLQPRLPSLYADLGARDVAEGPHGARGTEYPHRRPLDEPARAAADDTGDATTTHGTADVVLESLLPRVTDSSTRAPATLRPPSTAPRDNGEAAPSAVDGAPRANVANLSSTARASRFADSESGQVSSNTTHEPVDEPTAARGGIQPLLREPGHVAADTQPRATPLPTSPRAAEFESRNRRPARGEAAPSSHDVEIHIGRIDVVAAAPSVRAPPKNVPQSPSLGDYLNGRRGRRP